MLQVFKNPNYDFMRQGPRLMIVSLALMLFAVAMLAVRGLNRGIEFSGGTELQVKYAEPADLGTIRSLLEHDGLPAPLVTTIGDPSENEVYIRLATATDPDQEQDLTVRVTQALRSDDGQGSRLDLNVADAASIAELLLDGSILDREQATAAAEAIIDHRRDAAIFHSTDELTGIPGLTADVVERLRATAWTGPLAVRSQSYIGPAIGRELMNKAVLAIIGSLVGMLLYIWFRFQFRWGLAAVVALAHDTLITLGLFSLYRLEMSLPVVAAFLTLVGYSVNDTVVVFDRIRENMRNRVSPTFEQTINFSINQTLSRTVITSGLTFVVVFALYLFGGSALEPFAFVLSVGVVVGTYSSIFIASPLLVMWNRWSGGRRAAAAAAGGAERRARKVRSSTTG